MSSEYTFLHMLKDVFLNGNKVSGGKNDSTEEQGFSSGGSYDSSSSSTSSGEFDPSDSAGEAFRGVFGDDNL